MFLKLILSEIKKYQKCKKILHLVSLFFSYFNSYVISAPKIFRVAASENVVIQAHGYTEAFDATISIRSYPDKKITYSSGYVNLSPENKFQNSAMLTVSNYPSFSLCIFGKICAKLEHW